MDENPRHVAIVSALHRAVKDSPLSLFKKRLTPVGDIVSEQFNGTLEDGTSLEAAKAADREIQRRVMDIVKYLKSLQAEE